MMSAALLQGSLRLAAEGRSARPAVDRRFGLILLLSLVLHGGLFAVINGQRQASPVVLPPIFATLRFLAPAPSASESGSVAATPAPAARVAAAIPPKARQFPSRPEHPSARAETPSAGPANVPAQTAPATPAAPAAATSEHSPAASPAAPPSAAARPDSELLDGYRRRLGDLFARQQEYPRIAALRGWEGEVRLRLKVARKGQLLGVQVDRSSGFAVLDEHALAMVEALPGLPPLPEALEANEIQVVVPINYKLKKTT